MDSLDKLSKAEIVNAVDLVNPSPEYRARIIFDLLKKDYNQLTDWDMVCFSAQYLAVQALTDKPWLEDIVRELNRIIYTAHYMDRETLISTGIYHYINQNGTSNVDSSNDTEAKQVSEEIDITGNVEKDS